MRHLLQDTGMKNRIDRAVRPVVEGLESRQMLSANLAGVGGDNVLRIHATTQNADVVVVRPTKAGTGLRITVNKEMQIITIPAGGFAGIAIDGKGGHDFISVFGQIETPATIAGGAGHDTISGGAGADRLLGNGGHDMIAGGAGADDIDGGIGNDRLIGGAGDDNVIGGAGNDQITTGDGTDNAVGGAGKNEIRQGAKPHFPISTFTGVPTGYEVQEQRFAYGMGDLTDKSFTNRGQGQAIAIVIAYSSPNAARDLRTFSQAMGLPFKNGMFQQVKAYRGRTVIDEGWTGEAMLDIQWARAMAPEAKIYLVEARSNFPGDLRQGIEKATEVLNKKHGGGVVSMSWGTYIDRPYMSIFESTFKNPQTKNISFIASAGDIGAVHAYPSTSPNVTSIGGTSLYLDDYGNRIPPAAAPTLAGSDVGVPADASEYPWTAGGSGGASGVFRAPVYQRNRGIGPMRGTPDVSMNADPATGVPIFNSYGDGGASGWFTIGGTSASAPQFAGLVAVTNQLRAANNRAPVGSTLNQRIYAMGGRGADAYFNDIQLGATTGPLGTAFAAPGWDYATGWGTPRAQSLLPALAQDKLKFTNQEVSFTGTRSIYAPVTTTNNNQGGGTAAPVFALQWVGFKTKGLVQGLNTLNLNSLHFQQIYSAGTASSGTGGTTGGTGGTGTGGTGGTGTGGTGVNPGAAVTYNFDIFGRDPQTGAALPTTFDPLTGRVVVPGTPIVLYRTGNVITGRAYYQAGATTPNNNQGGGNQGGGTGGNNQPTTTGDFGAVQFRGKVAKNGAISGEFYAIDANGNRVKNVFNNTSVGIINGKFKA